MISIPTSPDTWPLPTSTLRKNNKRLVQDLRNPSFNKSSKNLWFIVPPTHELKTAIPAHSIWLRTQKIITHQQRGFKIFNGFHFPTLLHLLRTNPPGLVITVHLGLSRALERFQRIESHREDIIVS